MKLDHSFLENSETAYGGCLRSILEFRSHRNLAVSSIACFKLVNFGGNISTVSVGSCFAGNSSFKTLMVFEQMFSGQSGDVDPYTSEGHY